jgi:hypothetical protein
MPRQRRMKLWLCWSRKSRYFENRTEVFVAIGQIPQVCEPVRYTAFKVPSGPFLPSVK